MRELGEVCDSHEIVGGGHQIGVHLHPLAAMSIERPPGEGVTHDRRYRRDTSATRQHRFYFGSGPDGCKQDTSNPFPQASSALLMIVSEDNSGKPVRRFWLSQQGNRWRA